MNDMNKWDELFGDRRASFGPEIEQETCPVCGKRKWEVIGIGAVQRACDCAEALQVMPPQPPDDHAVTLTIHEEGGHVACETGLRGTWTEAGGFVVPFASVENAVDCLRTLIRRLERGGDA